MHCYGLCYLMQWEYGSKFIHPSWQGKIILLVCMCSSPMDTLMIEYVGISLNSVLSRPWGGLCFVFLWFGERHPNALGRESRNAVGIPWKSVLVLNSWSAKERAGFWGRCPATATISSISPVSRLGNVQEMQDGAQGSSGWCCSWLWITASPNWGQSCMDNVTLVFSHLKKWLFRLLILSHIEINNNSKAATAIKALCY